jgi:hypothetical protein
MLQSTRCKRVIESARSPGADATGTVRRAFRADVQTGELQARAKGQTPGSHPGARSAVERPGDGSRVTSCGPSWGAEIVDSSTACGVTAARGAERRRITPPLRRFPGAVTSSQRSKREPTTSAIEPVETTAAGPASSRFLLLDGVWRLHSPCPGDDILLAFTPLSGHFARRRPIHHRLRFTAMPPSR